MMYKSEGFTIRNKSFLTRCPSKYFVKIYGITQIRALEYKTHDRKKTVNQKKKKKKKVKRYVKKSFLHTVWYCKMRRDE